MNARRAASLAASNTPKVTAALTQIHGTAGADFTVSYSVRIPEPIGLVGHQTTILGQAQVSLPGAG